MANCFDTEHEWEVDDILQYNVIICVCEVCGEKAQFIKQEFD